MSRVSTAARPRPTSPVRPSRWSLRSSLLAGVVSLTAAALLLVGVAGALMLRGNLMGQVDEQLRGAAAVVGQGDVLPALEQEPVLQAYVSVTTFVIEVRKPDGELIRIHGSEPLPGESLLGQVGSGAPAPATVRADGGSYRVITVATGHGTVLVGASLAPVHQAVGRLIGTAVVTSLVVLLALVLLARLLVGRRLRPLDEIAATATALADGHLDRRVPAPPADDPAARTEVGRLTAAINGMLGRIQDALAVRERSEDRMRTFVADASHELRTPLTAIRGYLQLVRAGVLDLRKRPDVLGRIEDESSRMEALVSDLLYLARLDAEPTPRRDPVDLGALVRDAVADARAVEPDRPITMDAAGTGPVIPGDEDTLRQVLANLLANVRAHTPAGAAARIAVTVTDQDVRVSVSDDGPGLSAENARKAFGRFWRADTGRAPNGGTGLGLAIVDEVVRAHGGTAGLEPGPERGAVGWFTLPRFPTELSSISHDPRAGQADRAAAMDGRRRQPSAPTRGPALASLLHRLGAAMFRRRVAVIVVWLGVLLAAGAGAVTLSGQTVNAFEIPGQESTTALNLISDRFGEESAGASAQVAFEAPGGGAVTDPAVAAEITRVVGELRQLPGVVNATDPLDQQAPTVSPDRAAAYSTVTYDVAAPDLTEEQREALTEATHGATGMTVAATGDATQTPVEVGGPAELIGVIVALLVLALTYGSLVAAGMNLLTAVVGVGVGALGITALTGLVELQSTTPILAVMLGLAVGIDYALFIFTRFRHELRDGRTVADAVAMAVGTAGSAVLTAGLTVVIALAGLSVAGIPFLTEMGLAAAATVVIAVLVALTLVPAVLGLIGRRALPRRSRALDAPAAPTDRGFVRGWAGFVTRRRWVALLVPALVLAIVSVPFFSMRTTLQPSTPEGSTQAQAEQIIADHFGPGVAGPLLVLVDGPGAVDRAGQIAARAADLPDVATVLPPQPSPTGAAALITIVPGSAPDSETTEGLVHTLRDTFGGQDGPEVYVTGSTAVGVDVSEQLDSSLPGYLLLVVGLALILLILVFRSILVPVTAVLGFLLTIGAALGSTTAVFQWGWLAGVVQAESTGPLMSLTPIIVIGILFGLAMDYQVFLVSRMHEAHAHGMAPREAVVTGFRQAAPVVVAAASIMFAVFAGFVPEGDATIKPIAFALAVGVLVDAVVVRMIAMPAALALLGRSAWWLPSWLRRMPTLDVEGTALQRREPTDREPELTSV